jgi:3',5'-cyclic AMP phosphodiesterase CpdA
MRTRILVLAGVLLFGISSFVGSPSQSVTSTKYLVAVGDIASTINGPQVGVATLTTALDPDAVLLLGDLAYANGASSDFNSKFVPSWGPVLNAFPTYAVPGNHEYKTTNANGYREIVSQYGLPKTGNDLWWTKRIGGYTIIGLDSEKLSSAGKLTEKGRREQLFVKNALAANNGRPTIVAWHRPRYSSGRHGNQYDLGVKTLWNAISADRDVKLVLWGHDHNFENRKFIVSNHPVRTFVIGTGGAEKYVCNAASCIDDVYGVVRLALYPNKISWKFVSTELPGQGKTLKSGSFSW